MWFLWMKRALARRNSDEDDQPRLWALTGIGLELAASVGALTLLGWWLDSSFGTTPYLILTGAALGMVGGLYNLWRKVKSYL